MEMEKSTGKEMDKKGNKFQQKRKTNKCITSQKRASLMASNACLSLSHQYNNNDNDRLTAFDPGQPG